MIETESADFRGPSLVYECRLPLLCKRRHAFLLVFGGKGAPEGTQLALPAPHLAYAARKSGQYGLRRQRCPEGSVCSAQDKSGQYPLRAWRVQSAGQASRQLYILEREREREREREKEREREREKTLARQVHVTQARQEGS